MNAAIYSRSGGSMGIGFAIPANLARAIQAQLLEHGRVTRGFLGVGIQALTPALARAFDAGNAEGLLVTEVTSDGPAARAGVRADDILLTLDGRPVDGPGPCATPWRCSRRVPRWSSSCSATGSAGR